MSTAHSPSVLIVRLDAIGDAVTLVPLIAALRAAGSRVGAVLRPSNADVFSQRAVDCRHIITGNLRTLASEIEARRYAYALIATEKPAGYRLPAMARIPHRIGFENGWGKPLKTLWIRGKCTQTVFRTAGLDPRGPHECDVVFKLAQALLPVDAPPRDPNVLRPYLIDGEPQRDSRAVMQITDKWERLGASFESVVNLAKRASQMCAMRWIAAESERAYAQRFSEASGFEMEYFPAAAPWKDALAAARAVVAPDSGAVHVAGMVGTPVVACFAAAQFELQTARWAPWASAFATVKMQNDWPLVAADALSELLKDSRHSSYTG